MSKNLTLRISKKNKNKNYELFYLNFSKRQLCNNSYIIQCLHINRFAHLNQSFHNLVAATAFSACTMTQPLNNLDFSEKNFFPFQDECIE